MKKLYSHLTCAMLFGTTFAAYANGFYVGAGGGYDITDFHKTLTITENNTVVYDKKDNLTGDGFLGSLFAGYQFDFGQAFLAVQLDGSLSSLKYNGWYSDGAQNEFSTGTFSIHKSYGVSLLPGYNLNKNVGIYGRVGLERGELNYSESKSDDTSSNYGISESKWLNGLLVGLGARLPLTSQTALRFEYDHIYYDTFTDTAFPRAGRVFKLQPHGNLIHLDLIYQFS